MLIKWSLMIVRHVKVILAHGYLLLIVSRCPQVLHRRWARRPSIARATLPKLALFFRIGNVICHKLLKVRTLLCFHIQGLLLLLLHATSCTSPTLLYHSLVRCGPCLLLAVSLLVKSLLLVGCWRLLFGRLIRRFWRGPVLCWGMLLVLVKEDLSRILWLLLLCRQLVEWGERACRILWLVQNALSVEKLLPDLILHRIHPFNILLRIYCQLIFLGPITLASSRLHHLTLSYSIADFWTPWEGKWDDLAIGVASRNLLLKDTKFPLHVWINVALWICEDSSRKSIANFIAILSQLRRMLLAMPVFFLSFSWSDWRLGFALTNDRAGSVFLSVLRRSLLLVILISFWWIILLAVLRILFVWFNLWRCSLGLLRSLSNILMVSLIRRRIRQWLLLVSLITRAILS